MRESYLERKYMGMIAKLGYIPYKFVSPGNDGVPDRIIFGKYPFVLLVETKADGGSRVEPSQKIQIRRLASIGWEVHILKSIQDYKDIYEYLKLIK